MSPPERHSPAGRDRRTTILSAILAALLIAIAVLLLSPRSHPHAGPRTAAAINPAPHPAAPDVRSGAQNHSLRARRHTARAIGAHRHPSRPLGRAVRQRRHVAQTRDRSHPRIPPGIAVDTTPPVVIANLEQARGNLGAGLKQPLASPYPDGSVGGP